MALRANACDLVVTLTHDQLANYNRHGFVLLPGVVEDRLLRTCQAMLEPWVDYMVREWRAQGLIASDFEEFGFGRRFLEAWRSAGSPHFRRRPRRHLTTPQMFNFLKESVFLDIAQQLLGTPEVFVHGDFNGRPQLPGDTYTTLTPWHQDGQDWDGDYGGPEPDVERRTHVLTMWMPLQDVDEQSGCLMMISKEDTGDVMFPAHDYEHKKTGYQGLSPQDAARFPQHIIRMRRGDLVVFNQRTPHGAAPNLADHVRWSVDIRYEATYPRVTMIGKKYGFVARSVLDPSTETKLEEWLPTKDVFEQWHERAQAGRE